MQYDWDLKSTVVFHGPGAMECQKFYNTSDPCILYFTEQGLIAFIPSESKCCLDIPGIGASPPNWLANAGYAYNGTETINDVPCRRWEKEGFQAHIYWDSVLPNLDGVHVPCKFSFPQKDAPQDYQFFTASYTTDVDKTAFKLPFANCTEPCKK
eukprot:TRINITY_DN7815_c0_g2_i1.p1 TRINITY_DN7815_c0_g2~~TRINITY_DN7815_c0_g2_i1.p1  ORF type:complete len:154 (+),score=30.30 TRINITY_DN7815_c0_g2_i1:102-563(+)